MTNPKAKLIRDELGRFAGSENWYRHPVNPNILYADGAQYLAEAIGAYWPIDEIAIFQLCDKSVSAQPFQFWTLAVRADHTALLTCEDG